jgi:hypothetical protein
MKKVKYAHATDKIQSFLSTYLDETLLSALTMENLILRAIEMYQKTGGIALDTALCLRNWFKLVKFML